MGFFSKIVKKVKKGFKSIGKGIKSAFKKFGKFMGKIGIIGQLALMFTPVGAMMGNFFASIGQAAGGVFSKIVGKAAVQGAAGSGLLGSSSAILRGAGTVLKAAGNFAKAGHSAFRTVTDGISSFVSEFSRTALKKIPGMEKLMPSLSSASDTFFGENGAWDTVSKKVTTQGGEILKSFDEDIGVKVKPETATPVKVAEPSATTEVVSTTPEFGPLKEGYSGASVTDTSLLSPPQMSPIEGAVQASPAINPITGKPYDLSNRLSGKITEQVADSSEGFLTKFGQRTMEAVRSVPEKVLEMPEKFVENIGGSTQQALETKTMQKLGLQDKAVQNIYQTGVYVPEFTTAPAGSYGSPEINDRAMQVQLGGTNFYNQVPFGAGANFYVQTMSRGIGGTA
jgi:hypothetical protein